MKKISLQFKDVLQLIEFVEVTRSHQCPVDQEEMILTCELSEADIELAINGYNASVLEN